MKKYLIILISVLLLFSCNNKQSTKTNKTNKINKIETVSTQNPILLKFVNFNDSVDDCVLKIINNNVTIIENNNEVKGKFSNGSISTLDCDNCYRFGSGDDGEGIVLSVFSPEGNFVNNYFFDSESSSITYEKLQEYLGNNSFNENEFQGQKLEVNERVVKINWGMENTTNLTSDSDNDPRFRSEKITVPNGKVWILIYIDEHYFFNSGLYLDIVPNLFVDNENIDWIYRRNFSNKDNINISKAKIENLIFQSNQTIFAVSDRQQGSGMGEDFYEYKGEMWFLETTMSNDLEQKRNAFDLNELKEQNRILQENINATNRSIRAKRWQEDADRRRMRGF